MSTALLIFRILMVLWDEKEELADLFHKLMAAVQPTVIAGNPESAKKAIMFAESILPVLPADKQTIITTALEDFKKTPEYQSLISG